LGNNELDRRANMDQGYSSRLEVSDRHPRADTMQRLADALGVNIGWLISGEGPSGLEDVPEPVPAPTASAGPAAGAKPDARYPNREVALAALHGLVAIEVETAIRTVRLSRDDDPTVDEWIEMIMAMQRRRDRARAELAAGKAPPVVGTDEQVLATYNRLKAEAGAVKKKKPV
jgi:hypothetical protein